MRFSILGLSSIFFASSMLSAGCGGGDTSTGGTTGSSSTGIGAGGGSATSTSSSSSATTGSATTGAGGSSTSSGTGAGVGLGGFACSGTPVGFAADVAPLIHDNCAGAEGCHQLIFKSPAGIYAFMGQMGTDCPDGRLIAKPGDPEHSYVIDKVTDHDLCNGSAPMPKPFMGQPWIPLQKAQIQTIYDWICEGAKND